MIDLAKIKEMAAEKRKKNTEHLFKVLENSIWDRILNKLVEEPTATKAYHNSGYFCCRKGDVHHAGEILLYLEQNNLWDTMVKKFKDEGITLKTGDFFKPGITITWS